MLSGDVAQVDAYSIGGLTTKNAKKRLKKYGLNTIPQRPPPSSFKILVSQFKNPLVYILVLAGLVTAVLGKNSDTLVIFIAVIINTILGFLQEKRASRALSALKKLIHPRAQVIRDQKISMINIESVVPGDVCILKQGDKVPADGELIYANRLYLNEAILTGESGFVKKIRNDQVFMGTVVASGRAAIKVENTGKTTKIGTIAKILQEPSEKTPLQEQLGKLSKQLSIFVLALTFFVFFVGFIVGRDVEEMFIASVALAVSAIPEGLLVGLTVVLAIGMQRILARRGLVKSLLSAETLGGVTTICVDKTGTLTEGKMKVVGVDGSSDDISLQLQLANDYDDPVVVAAYDWAVSYQKGNKKTFSKRSLTKDHPRLDSLPFSPETRFFASLNKWNSKKNIIFVNGAPDYLINWTDFNAGDKKKVVQRIESLTKQGKRVVGLARKTVSSKLTKLTEKDAKRGLDWVGVIAFSDPVRKGVKGALLKTKKAGVNLVVITGDYLDTALSTIKQLGIKVKDECVMLGSELDNFSSKQLSKRLSEHSREVMLFARTTPSQKLKIVEALKTNKQVVAMMGDGVNDAPALEKADIGIVVGQATDVARESADLVLLDSSFETIISAIEEGRGIYDNIRKIILYLMSDAFEEIIAVVGTIILSLPLPVTAAQILWINLVSDGFPDLALTVDPKEKGIMERGPRRVGESIISSWMKRFVIIISLSGGLIALGLFIIFYLQTKDLILSRSITFAALGVNSLVYVFSIRTLTDPVKRATIFANRWLNLAVLAGMFLQIAPFAFEKSRVILGIVQLNIFQWTIVFLSSIIMFIIVERSKVIFYRTLKRDSI
jgi:Ca2+-transporting ATPase